MSQFDELNYLLLSAINKIKLEVSEEKTRNKLKDLAPALTAELMKVVGPAIKRTVTTPAKIEMEQGKIYFISFGSSTQLIVRYKDNDACNYNFYDHIHYWNSFENFHKRTGQNHCVKHGIKEIREATLAEKHALLKFEIEFNCI
jgi:hypothetical protein